MTDPPQISKSSGSSVFNRVYVDQYDLLYQEKNYESECDMIEEAFRRYSKIPVHTILDLGCGTGNHVIPLGAKRLSGNRGRSFTGYARPRPDKTSIR